MPIKITDVQKARAEFGLTPLDKLEFKSDVKLSNNQSSVGVFFAIIACIAGALVVIAILGLSLPIMITGCSCQLEGGCRGCGEFIGNALGSFGLHCLALGAMGLVLLMWFGLPIALLLLLVMGVYKLFSKANSP